MAQPAPDLRHHRDDPPIEDREAIERAYHMSRARRRARVEHRRTTRRARLRFWITLLVLAAASVLLALTIWREIQNLFGL